MAVSDWERRTTPELIAEARRRGIRGAEERTRAELVAALDEPRGPLARAVGLIGRVVGGVRAVLGPAERDEERGSLGLGDGRGAEAGLGDGRGTGVGDGRGTGVGPGLGDGVGLGLGDGLGSGDGLGLGDGLGDGLGLGVERRHETASGGEEPPRSSSGDVFAYADPDSFPEVVVDEAALLDERARLRAATLLDETDPDCIRGELEGTRLAVAWHLDADRLELARRVLGDGPLALEVVAVRAVPGDATTPVSAEVLRFEGLDRRAARVVELPADARHVVVAVGLDIDDRVRALAHARLA